MAFALYNEDGDLSQKAICKQIDAMIKHRVHGVGILGLASEGNKLSLAERRQFMEWVAERLDGRLPLCVTISEPSVKAQIAFAHEAERIGAQWIILQPPSVGGVPELELVRFFGAVADRCNVPVAIQNAPQYLGAGLGPSGLMALRRNHPNIRILKLEASAVEIAQVLDATGGEFHIFNGRAGIEMIDAMRAGCVGIIPGGESFDKLKHIYDGMISNDDDTKARSKRMYCSVLPLLNILMHSIDCYLVHGKRVLCKRLGIPNEWVRPPSGGLTRFGAELMDRYAAELGPL
jgi:4-hydroxy-tetrahydrodipicolinate synthase